MTASSPLPKKLGIRIASPVKSTPPASKPTMGMTISLTRELTIAVNAPPTATPTARSTTEPRLMNSINSLRKFANLCSAEIFKASVVKSVSYIRQKIVVESKIMNYCEPQGKNFVCLEEMTKISL